MSLAQYDQLTREVASAMLREFNTLNQRRPGLGRLVLDPFYDYHAKAALRLDPIRGDPVLHYARPLSEREMAQVRSLTRAALRVLEREFGLRIPEPEPRKSAEEIVGKDYWEYITDDRPGSLTGVTVAALGVPADATDLDEAIEVGGAGDWEEEP